MNSVFKLEPYDVNNMYAYAQAGPSSAGTGSAPSLHYSTTPPQSAPSPSYYHHHHPSFSHHHPIHHPHLSHIPLNHHQLDPSNSSLNNSQLPQMPAGNLIDHQQHNPYLHHSLTPPQQSSQNYHQQSPTMPSSPAALGPTTPLGTPTLMPPQHHHSIHNMHHHLEPQLTELTPQNKRRR